MSSIMDLDGLLFNDEQSISNQLLELVAAGQLTKAWRVVWTARLPGSRSFTPAEEAAVGDTPLTVAAVPNVMDALHKSIVRVLGSSPLGQLTIRVFSAGEKGKPILQKTATLSAEGDEGGGPASMWKELYYATRAALSESWAQLRELQAQLRDNNTQFAHGQVEAFKSMAQIASARNVTGAIGDIYGVGGFFGVILLGILVPMVRDALKLKKDTPVLEVIDTLQAVVRAHFSPSGEPTPQIHTTHPKPPAGAVQQEPAANTTPPDDVESSAPACDLTTVSADDLIKEIKRRCQDPASKAEILMAALQHDLRSEF
jgi:hypothetical protein